jgi:hypothetical protein
VGKYGRYKGTVNEKDREIAAERVNVGFQDVEKYSQKINLGISHEGETSFS